MAENVLTFAEVLSEMKLSNVICRRMEVDRESDGPAESVRLDSSFRFGLQEDQVLIEVGEELHIMTTDEQPFAKMSATYVVIYALPGAQSLLSDQESLQQDITRFAHMAAHPYIRASISDLGNQVGIPGLALGFLRQGSTQPETVTVLNKMFAFDNPEASTTKS